MKKYSHRRHYRCNVIRVEKKSTRSKTTESLKWNTDVICNGRNSTAKSGYCNGSDKLVLNYHSHTSQYEY